MIPAKPLDWVISNIKYRLGKYYVRVGLIPPPKVRVCRNFSNLSPFPQDPYVINEWPFTFLQMRLRLLTKKIVISFTSNKK